MYIITVIVAILILVAFFEYLYALNPQRIPLHYAPGKLYVIHNYLIIYIFAAFLIGIAIILIINVLKDSIVQIKNIFYKRKQYIKTELDNSVNKAFEAYIKGQYDKGIDLIKKYSINYPNNIGAYLLLVKIYKHKGKIKEAENALNKALEIEKENVTALNEAGNLYKLNKEYDKAVFYFNKALEYSSDDLYAISQLKDIFIKKEEWKNAYRMSKLFLSQSKDKDINKKEEQVMLGLKYEFGKYLLETENDTVRSMKRFNQVLSQDKNFVPAYLSLGDALIKKEKINEAFELWEKAFLKTSNLAIAIKIEDVSIKTNHPENIIRFYQELIYDNPERWEYRLFLGKLYIRLEMIDDAIETLSLIPANIFKDNALNLLLAECYFKRGKYNDASVNFRKALKNNYPVKLPFVCSNCGYTSYNYSSICPSCNKWNTYNIKTAGTLYEVAAKDDEKNISSILG
ncbi:MAG: tetratricopeptide repeat protein [Candidatus Acidulodesulfobacterium acidiphilum]|uniref:Tetratricopeptide repeat protein n=1 Tax=Candidatus Acidulodesulfobacterium acidiphilum TaxID=2597224 RepID=A0A520XEH8_9DELT|nr:MAG: tetratricopeptide repeat protein [Candidatus Acidulodesulfobacterium acidiphilum]